METLDLDKLCESTLEKIKYIWEPQSKDALKESLKFLSTSGSSDELESSKDKRNRLDDLQQKSLIYSTQSDVAPPLKRAKLPPNKSLGKGWFNLEPMELDESTKKDLKIIKLRNYLDPKRFYKNPDKMTKVLHVGTVIEGSGEYLSNRMSRKERKQSIVDEVLNDKSLSSYAKSTYNTIQKVKSSKKKIFSFKKKFGNMKKGASKLRK